MMDSSDDDLEEAPVCIKNASPIKSTSLSSLSSSSSQQKLSLVSEKSTKLDLLLSETRKENEEEEYLNERKEEILNNILHGSQEENSQDRLQCSGESLAEEQAYHIEKLELKTSCLLNVHPGQRVINGDNVGEIFNGNISPLQCGFVPSGLSSIDILFKSLEHNPEKLLSILQSKILLASINKISEPTKVLTWLLFVSSVHKSPAVSQLCYKNIKAIISNPNQYFKVKSWCPSVLDMLKIFVNFGADKDDILPDQDVYTEKEISECLTPNFDKITECVTSSWKDNLGLVLQIYSLCLQSRPCLTKAALNIVFLMVTKISLDSSLKDFLHNEIQSCLNNIIECYQDEDWPDVVYDLCIGISKLSTHLHDQAYLTSLFVAGSRMDFVNTRLGYMFLSLQMGTPGKILTRTELMDFTLTDVTWLGKEHSTSEASTLATSLLDMINSDELYDVFSVLRLLDFAVGGDISRAKRPKDQLEYLLGQLKLVISDVRDSIFRQDLSKIKDVMSRMKVKWTLTLNKPTNNQRSIFTWATCQETVSQELLRDHDSSQTDIDEDLCDL